MRSSSLEARFMVAIRWPWPVMVPAKGELAYDEYHAEFGSSEGIESASSWTYNEDTSRIWVSDLGRVL